MRLISRGCLRRRLRNRWIRCKCRCTWSIGQCVHCEFRCCFASSSLWVGGGQSTSASSRNVVDLLVVQSTRSVICLVFPVLGHSKGSSTFFCERVGVGVTNHTIRTSGTTVLGSTFGDATNEQESKQKTSC